MDVSKETAVQYYNEGRYEDAVYILELLANEQTREYGPNSVITLETRTWITDILVEQEQYVDALKMLLDIYKKYSKTLPLKHPISVNIRNRIYNLLVQNWSIEVLSEVMQDCEKTFRHLMKVIRKKYRSGLYTQAMEEGVYTMNDMMELLGRNNAITLDMACLVAVINSTTEEYFNSLQMIKDVCEKKKRIFGIMDRRVARTVMTKASVYLKIGNFEEALKCYCEAYSIRQYALGRLHRKTLVSLRCLAKTLYTVGNYEQAFLFLTDIARIQKFHRYKELILTKIHIGILELARGNYEDAFYILRNISIKRRTAKHIRAMIQNNKGAALAKLGRYSEAIIILRNACEIMKLSTLRAETLNTYRNLAVLVAKEGRVGSAETILIVLIATAVVMIHPRHSLVLSMENDLADLWFSKGQFEEALRVFMKVWDFQSEKFGEFHPETLRTKCHVAKVFKEQGRYDDALRMYNEVLPVLKAHFYSQHLDCLDVENRIASIYLSRNSFLEAYEIYYKIYKILADNYQDDHPFLIEITERMQNLADRVPLRRVIEATLMENMDDLRTLIENGEDVNSRDVNGAVALHFASRQGNVHILMYLLNKGAVYDTEDMFGNTPESFSANGATSLVFLLVRRLFECIENGDLEMMRQILQRQRLIINARDSAYCTPLMKAVAKGNFQIVQELVSQGADLSLGTKDVGNVLHMAAENEHIYILELILWHLKTTNLDLFRILIDSTANELGMTPLHVAAKNNSQGCVETLIFHEANPLLEDVLGKRPYDLGPPEMQDFIRDYSFDVYNRFDFYNRNFMSGYEPEFQ